MVKENPFEFGKQNPGGLHVAGPDDRAAPERPSPGFQRLKEMIENKQTPVSRKDLNEALHSSQADIKITAWECFDLRDFLLERKDAREVELEATFKKSHLDERTGLWRYELLKPHLSKLIQEAAISKDKDKRPHRIGFLFLLFDIDDFKKFNEKYGYEEANRALAEVGLKLKSITHRPGDLAVRYGGEEVGVVLQLESKEHLTDEDILKIAESKREELNQLLSIEATYTDKRTHTLKTEIAPIVLSMGVAFVREGSDPTITPETVIKTANEGLERDKKTKAKRLVKAKEALGLSK